MCVQVFNNFKPALISLVSLILCVHFDYDCLIFTHESWFYFLVGKFIFIITLARIIKYISAHNNLLRFKAIKFGNLFKFTSGFKGNQDINFIQNYTVTCMFFEYIGRLGQLNSDTRGTNQNFILLFVILSTIIGIIEFLI